MAKIETRSTLVDQETGEVLHDVSKVVSILKLPKEPAYLKLYIEDMSRFLGINQSSYQHILLYVAAAAAYDGVVTLNARRKAAIALTTGTSVKTINNAITKFVKTEVLRRVGHGDYEINPHLFAKGEWNEIRLRRERFKFTVYYDPIHGRQVEGAHRISDDERERARLEKQGQQRLFKEN